MERKSITGLTRSCVHAVEHHLRNGKTARHRRWHRESISPEKQFFRDPADGIAKLRASGPVVATRFPIVGRVARSKSCLLWRGFDGSALILATDWKPIVWIEQERKKARAWG